MSCTASDSGYNSIITAATLSSSEVQVTFRFSMNYHPCLCSCCQSDGIFPFSMPSSALDVLKSDFCYSRVIGCIRRRSRFLWLIWISCLAGVWGYYLDQLSHWDSESCLDLLFPPVPGNVGRIFCNHRLLWRGAGMKVYMISGVWAGSVLAGGVFWGCSSLEVTLQVSFVFFLLPIFRWERIWQ